MIGEYAFCKVPIAPVRIDHADASEMVTQLMFGELVEILLHEKQWLFVRSCMDAYEGWVDFKQVQVLREKEVSRWLDGLTIEHAFCRKVLGPEGEFTLFKGAFRPIDSNPTFNIGKANYQFIDNDSDRPTSVLDFAQSFLSSPYLWGGKSVAGIDCSGFVQTVFRLFDFKLPRDASQQIEVGQHIDFDERQAGDLAFFRSDSGKIHHVGILLSTNEIIHAHGYVRIDDFSEAGITRKIDGVLSHKFAQLNRIA